MKQVAWILLALWVNVAFADNCDLVLRVIAPSGRAVEEPVLITDKTGRLVLSTRSKGGEVRACDLGFGTYEVTVGRELCGQVRVRHVQTHPGSELKLSVIHQNCHIQSLSTGCQLLIRMRTRQGRPFLERAVLESDAFGGHIQSDPLGRFLVAVPFDREWLFKAIVRNRVIGTLRVKCERTEQVLERTLIVQE